MKILDFNSFDFQHIGSIQTRSFWASQWEKNFIFCSAKIWSVFDIYDAIQAF